ncbi:S24 family peptidase [Campylobacter jejuni]|nr:S24 family peptidase [Campylobacter jejuni]
MNDFESILNFLRYETNSKTDKEMCVKLNIPYGTLDTWKARKSIPTKKLYEFSKILGVNIDTIINGNINTNENENFQLINIDKAFLTDVLGVPYKTQYNMIKIYGESMEPFIQNGSFIIIDTTKNSLDKIRNADVVIFRKDDELFCKRILKNAFDDDIVISSDNFNFGDKKVKKSALKDYVFIGVVVCSCNAKIFLNQIERV